MHFNWDKRKAFLNERKHGVTFGEAASAFYDGFARVLDDPGHSFDEERFILLGLSRSARLLVVCHCLRLGGEEIRIISARKATRKEAAQYWRYRNEG